MRDEDDSDNQYDDHHDKDEDHVRRCAKTREEARVGLAQMISCGITSVISPARHHHQYFAHVQEPF